MERSLKTFIEKRLAELGISAFEAARQAGMERGFINDLIQGKKTSIRQSNLAKLANALQVSLGELIEKSSSNPPPEELINWINNNYDNGKNEADVSIDEFQKKYPGVQAVKSLPIYSLIKTSTGATIITPQPNDYIATDEFIKKFNISFLVTVYDDYMEPELEPGDKAIIDAMYPPARGGTYIFVSTRGLHQEVCFGRIIDMTSDEWIIRQWRPERDIRLEKSKWPDCQKVAGKLSR